MKYSRMLAAISSINASMATMEAFLLMGRQAVARHLRYKARGAKMKCEGFSLVALNTYSPKWPGSRADISFKAEISLTTIPLFKEYLYMTKRCSEMKEWLK
jgi:hypothetical protein